MFNEDLFGREISKKHIKEIKYANFLMKNYEKKINITEKEPVSINIWSYDKINVKINVSWVPK